MLRSILLLAGLGLATSVHAETMRLPRTVLPSAYALHFEPDLERGRFRARALIDVDISAPTRRIVLHAAGLEITRAMLRHGGRVLVPRLTSDAATETLTLTVDTELSAGRAQLEFAWHGVLDRNLRGWYRAEADGQTYLATQLQATDARRMFPAFDEPAFKARFTLSVTLPEALTAISNAPEAGSTPGPGPGRRTLRFEPTPPLPTYLLALLVGDFECLSDTYRDIPLRVCALRGRAERGHFALAFTRHALAWFEDYYGMPMPFAKLDQIAIPDFAWGAMENPGAVVYHEDYLLTSADAPDRQRRDVTITVAHELAHLWFGDLVTLTWWDEVWLNEGFATWLETRPQATWRMPSEQPAAAPQPDAPGREEPATAASAALPSSGLATHQVVKGESLWKIAATRLHDGYRWQELWSANPHIEDPDRIEVGDLLVLPGVAAPAPMAAAPLDLPDPPDPQADDGAVDVPPVLLAGTPDPAGEFGWDPRAAEAEATSLALESDASSEARAMQQAVSTPGEIEAAFDSVGYFKSAAVLRMIEAWLGPERFRDGVRAYLAKHAWGNTTAQDFGAALSAAADRPAERVLTSFVNQPGVPVVRIATRCQDGRTRVSLEQRRYGLGADRAAAQTGWVVPVCLSRPAGEHCELLSARRATLELDGCAGPLMGNAGARGYYLVDHTGEAREALLADFARLSTSERRALLRDEWWLFQAGTRDVGEWLALADHLHDEQDAYLYFKRLLELERTLVGDRERPGFVALTRGLGAARLADALAAGPGDERAAWWLATLGNLTADPQVLSRARAVTEAWLADPVATDTETAAALLPLAARHADADLHTELSAVLDDGTADTARRDLVLRALGEVRDPALVTRNLALARAGAVEPDELATLFGVQFYNPAAARSTWDELRARWTDYESRWPPGHLALVLASIAGTCDAGLAAEIQAFFALRPRHALAGEVARATEASRRCADRRNREAPRLFRALERHRASGQPAGG